MIIRTDTWNDLVTPSDRQRRNIYRARLRERADFDYHVHNARVHGGVEWQDAMRHRPIPRHRALITIPQGCPS